MTPWTTACGNATCIEVRAENDDGIVAIRSTHVSVDGHDTIWCTPDEWRAFLTGAKNGDFDEVLPA